MLSPLIVDSLGWRALLYGSGGFLLVVWWLPWLLIVHSTPDLTAKSSTFHLIFISFRAFENSLMLILSIFVENRQFLRDVVARSILSPFLPLLQRFSFRFFSP